MKLLILGSTGRTGKELLALALQNGHQVNILVRDKSKVSATAATNLHIFEGLPTDKNSLTKATIGCEAIISVLNIARNSDFPWAKLRTSSTFLSDTMQQIIAVANEQNIKRIVVCSAFGTNETKKNLPFWFRWLIDNSNIGVAYRDHEKQEKLLQNSSLAYTIVLPVGLTNSQKEEKIKVSFDNSPKPSLMISRRNVAKFMLDVAEQNSYLRQMPIISNL